MFDAIRDHFRDYSQQLPKDLAGAAVQSAVYSFVISALLSGNVQVGVTTGALAATVTLIGGLTMPIFREALSSRGNMAWYEQAIAIVINLALAQYLINSFTAYRVNLMAGALFTVGLNLLLHGFKDQSTHSTPSYILI
jgi:hypothetical protein